MAEQILQIENVDPKELHGPNDKYLELVKSMFPKLKIIIIYTADVKHGTTDPYLDMDAVNEAVDKSVEQIAINLYKAGDSIEKISECVGLSLTRLEEIFAPLKA